GPGPRRIAAGNLGGSRAAGGQSRAARPELPGEICAEAAPGARLGGASRTTRRRAPDDVPIFGLVARNRKDQHTCDRGSGEHLALSLYTRTRKDCERRLTANRRSLTPEKTASDDSPRIVARKKRWPQVPAISATVASFRTWRGSQLLRHPGP